MYITSSHLRNFSYRFFCHLSIAAALNTSLFPFPRFLTFYCVLTDARHSNRCYTWFSSFQPHNYPVRYGCHYYPHFANEKTFARKWKSWDAKLDIWGQN